MSHSKLLVRIHVILASAALSALSLFAGEGRLELSQSMMPITISQSGSYVLTEDLTGTSGSHGIRIETSDVSLDLNGFALIGVSGSLDGIRVTGNYRNISIRNGTVRSWRNDGVQIDAASNCVLMVVRSVDNLGDGFRVDGNLIVDCEARGNGGDGFQVGRGCVILRCTARDNGGNGIITGDDCTLSLCVVRTNGAMGIVTGVGCSVLHCTSRESGESGVAVGTATAVAGCAVGANGGNGIECTGGGVRIGDCTVHANAHYGIVVGQASLVRDNTLRANGAGGILVSNHAYVVANSISDSASGTGIMVFGVRSRIEGNHLTQNSIGIDVDGSDCVIVKNTAAGNTSDDYQIGVGNHFEEYSPAGSMPNRPWVNFEF